jgi:hypothetical protein
VSNKIFIHDVVSGLKGEKSWKRQRTKNCKLFQRKNKIVKNMHITANSGQSYPA